MRNIPAEHQAGFLISKIQKLSQEIFRKMLMDNGVDIYPGYGRVLYVLWKEGGGISIKDLIKKTGLPKTTLTSVLDELENKKKKKDRVKRITRVSSKEDGRKKIVKLTSKSKKEVPIYEEVSVEMGKLYYKGFSDDEKTQLDDYLKRILQNLQKI